MPMLSPTWTQISLGPLLRRETDLRHYADLFLPGCEEVTGARGLWVKLCSRRVSEEENPTLTGTNGRPVLKVFAGEQDRFLQLNGSHEFLRTALREITRPHWLEAADQIQDVAIGMHVRMGDFVDAQAEPNNPHRRVPHSWFAESLRTIRSAVGYPIRAIVVSDGKESELGELLDQQDVSLVRTGSAISDLLVLSRSKVLIASAGSSFSAWAAFLGQMPTIAHPFQSLAWFNLVNHNNYYVGGADPAELPESFVRQVKTIFGG